MCSTNLKFAAIALVLLSNILPAQSPRPVPIEPLLRNDDPRLVALGAWEIVRRQDDSQNDLLVDLAERWNSERLNEYQGEDWFDAMTVVLDALIQRQVKVSPAAVQSVASTFPAQALILTARMNPVDAEPILQSWFQAGRERPERDADSKSRRLLARIAAMFLARDHPDEIAASVLEDSVEQFVVSVPDVGSVGIDRCLLACPARPQCTQETEGEPRTAWPLIFQYSLEENDPDIRRRNGFLIYAGGDTITWRRVEAWVDQNHCYAPEPLNAENRHHLLAEMLRVRDSGIAWAPQMNLTLPWNTDQQYLSDLRIQIAVEEDRLHSTVQAFFARSLLTKSQLETIRPRLFVLIFDDRAKTIPRPALPLPGIQKSWTTLPACAQTLRWQ